MCPSNSTPKREISSKAVTIGYAITALGLVSFLTINGSSEGSQFGPTVTLALIGIGLSLPAAGMLTARNGFNEGIQVQVRRGLFLLGLGLIILLSGVVFAVASSSLTGLLFGAVFLIASGTLALVGEILLQKNCSRFGASQPREVAYLMLGTAMLFIGVVAILVSNIASSFYTISQVENIILSDIGSTVSAYGCVVSAYSFFCFRLYLHSEF